VTPQEVSERREPSEAEPAPEKPVRVILADDHALVREGMAEILSLEADFEIVGQAGDGREAVALAKETSPEVVILDVEMPVMGAQGALKRLLDLPSPPKVVIVTVFAEPRLVRELVGLGASAFLAKNASSQDLVNTVRSVARGAGGHNVTLTVPRETFETGEPPEDDLSRREVEILRLVARGMGNVEVAQKLHVSAGTVKRHLANAYKKLGARTRGEAVSRAVSEGWISSWDIVKDE
jgi:DNA-binding NarL/FixJ family response regulator